jgi:hypothetical protein
MSQRFVILRHSGHGPLHYDWMFEAGDALATWQTAEGPDELFIGKPVGATKLPDHRLAYLDYEGPVSGDRGSVERIAEGTCVFIERSAMRWVIELSEKQGVIILARGEEDSAESWQLSRAE